MGVREQTAKKRDWLRVPEAGIAIQPLPALRLVDGTDARGLRHAVLPARQRSALQLFAKRSLDLAVAAFLLVLLAPVLIAVGIAIRLDSPGSAFFRQWRGGLNGKPFRILKFRTLTVTEDGDAVTQVTTRDPRVTRAGQLLRRLSFDELPQLINVIRGEMSLVGPRPHALAHDRDFSRQIENYALRLSVKPGMSGWAQINGQRGETTLEDMRRRIGFDLWYVNRASFLLDLRILLATPRAVLFGRNAW